MKQRILLLSLASSVIATGLGIAGVFATSGHIITGDADAVVGAVVSAVRCYQLAGIFGLLGIGSFFVGLAYPVSTAGTSNNGGTTAITAGGSTKTRRASNS